MAFNEQQISPLDFNPATGVGVNIPFNANGVFQGLNASGNLYIYAAFK